MRRGRTPIAARSSPSPRLARARAWRRVWQQWVCGLSHFISAVGTDGRTLLRTPLADAVVDAFGFAWYQMHRADLLTTLARALPPERVHVGHRLVALVDHGDASRGRLRERRSRPRRRACRCGWHPLDGPADPVRPAERPFHRLCGLSRPYPGRAPEPSRSRGHGDVWMGPGRHFVHYFVRNEQLFNFVTAVEQDSWTGESWTDKVDVATALAEFEGGTPGTRHHRRGRRDVHLGALRPASTQTLVGRAHDAPRRCLPSDAAVHGPRRCTSDRGRRNAHGLPRRAPAAQTSRRPSIATSNSGYPAPHVCRRCPRRTRRASTSPTAPNKEERDAQMATGSTDFSKSAIAWIYEHDATRLEP